MKFSFAFIISALKLLVWLPLLSIISYELNIILTNKGFEFFSTINSYVLCIALLVIALIVSVVLKVRQHKSDTSTSKLLSNYYLPMFIFGIVSYIYYSPFVVQPQEIFELANPANSLMRFFEFGEIPMIDFLSSHLLSEQLFSFIYTFFNGYDGGLGFLSYNFLYHSMAALIIYYFFLFLFRNGFLAFLLTLLFPFTSILIPNGYVFILPTLIFFNKLIEHYSTKRLIHSVLWILFLISWKPEVALANLYLSFTFLIIYLLFNFKKKIIYDYLKILGTVLGVGMVVIVLIYWYSDSNVLINLKKALSYFTANQAHGLVKLTNDTGRYFKYHYFLFPSLIVFSSLGVLVILIKKKHPKIISRVLFIFLFLTVIYFITAQRGLVRHNMFDHSGRFSGFLFLMLGLLIIFLNYKKAYSSMGMVFIASSTLLISNFAFPEKQEVYSPFETFIERITNHEKVWMSGPNKVERVIDDELFVKSNFGDIKRFLDNNIPETSTFYDFSNTPMSYFYTKRTIPCYFNQMPICVINKELQDLHLADINNFNIPIAFFSNNPQKFWDHIDGVPNALRHSYIANYLYENYTPYCIINNHTTWLKKEEASKIQEKNETILWSNNTISKKIAIPKLSVNQAKFTVLRITTVNPMLHYPEFKINNSKEYVQRITQNGSYEIFIANKLLTESINLSYIDSIKSVALVAMDYCPDTTAIKACVYDIKKLPFIMGKYSNLPTLYQHGLPFEFVNSKSVRMNCAKNDAIGNEYIELVLKPVQTNQKVSLAYHCNGVLLGEFTFDVTASSEFEKYQIPVYCQYNWNKFPIDKIDILSSINIKNTIHEVSIINK